MSATLTAAEAAQLGTLLDDVAGDRDSHRFVLSELLGRPVTDDAQPTYVEWRKVRAEACPNWNDGDWTVTGAFRSRVTEIVRRYEEQVLGQRDLFAGGTK